VRGALALCLSVVLADVAGSLFLIRDGMFLDRPLPPFGALTHPRQREKLASVLEAPRDTGVFDPELGWTWRPSTASPDGLSCIDALGARGPREYETRPPAGTRRIVTFGDSFTFGDEVPVEASFQWQLEHLEPGLEVLNFGVSGYGTDQALLRYRRVGRGLGAEAACMGILLENIGRNVNRYRPLWNTRTGICSTKPRFVLDARGELELVPQPFASRAQLHEAILDDTLLARVAEHEYWLGPSVPTGKVSSIARLLFGWMAYRARTPALLWQEPTGEPFRVTLAILETFQREARQDGVRLAPILIFPAKEDLERYALPGKPYWDTFLAELERRGLAHLDLIAPLTARARELGSNWPSLYCGGHLSSVGNAVVAHELQAWLQRNSW